MAETLRDLVRQTLTAAELEALGRQAMRRVESGRREQVLREVLHLAGDWIVTSPDALEQSHARINTQVPADAPAGTSQAPTTTRED